MKSRKKTGKFLCVALAVLLSVCSFSSVASAAITTKSEFVSFETDDELHLAATMASQADAVTSDFDGFRDYLVLMLPTFPTRLTVSQFGIENSKENIDALGTILYNDSLMMFHIDGYSYNYNTSTHTINSITPRYNMTQAEYNEYLNGIAIAEEYILRDLRTSNLTDVEKALLVHDRLAVWAEYDYGNYLSGTIPTESYHLTGVLAKKTGVCAGYAKAYNYLMGLLGIESRYVSSDSLNHAWNIVTINGVEYHVDVTWDDPTIDRYGFVRHTNFLRSTNGMISTRHNANDYDSSPTDTTYDNYYWQDSTSEFQLIDGTIYYLDNVNSTINSIVGTTSTQIKSVSQFWGWQTTLDNGHTSKYYSKLSSCDNNLVYSTKTDIRKLDLTTNETSIIYTPQSQFEHLTDSFVYSPMIIGFKYYDNTLFIDINQKPSYESETERTEYGTTVMRHRLQLAANDGTNNITDYMLGFGEENINLPACPYQRTGYTFTGWNTCADGSGSSFTDGAGVIITGDALIYAMWTCAHSSTRIESNVLTASTCTESGSMLNVYYCETCGEEMSRETVELPAAHTFSEYVYDSNASTHGDGTMTAVCTVCGATDTINADGTMISTSGYTRSEGNQLQRLFDIFVRFMPILNLLLSFFDK